MQSSARRSRTSRPSVRGQAADALGFGAGTADWRTIVADPRIDVVDICTPNHLHAEMALAAIAAGKHVYCEKPLALDIQESVAIVEAARRARVCNVIGFNYICNPMVQRGARDDRRRASSAKSSASAAAISRTT